MMDDESDNLVHGYLDETLTEEQFATLAAQIKSDPAFANDFSKLVALHDRLQREFVSEHSDLPKVRLAQSATPKYALDRRSFVAFASTIGGVLLGIVVWQNFTNSSVSAASSELDRIISISSRSDDRCYALSVEESVMSSPKAEARKAEDRRPPKPPLDGAMLYVRGPNRFVLQRRTSDGRLFVTGSDGQTSWAVSPDGPVRVSDDLTRFNRDLPGHEVSLPLDNIWNGLQQLRNAYQLELMPEEPAYEGDPSTSETNRLLIAVKRKGYRGPRRVEITYGVHSGQILQMRFVDMPYGPDRLTLRVTLLEQSPLGESFFEYRSHHESNRSVVWE